VSCASRSEKRPRQKRTEGRWGWVEQQERGDQVGLIEGEPQSDQTAQAVADDHDPPGPVSPDRVGEEASVVVQRQPPTAACRVMSRRIQGDDARSGGKGLLELGREVAGYRGAAARNEQNPHPLEL
jgi:hypothetical protein